MNKAASDSAMTAELLVLFRMILADSEASEQGVAAFRRICHDAFDIGDEDFDLMMGFVDRMGESTGGARALSVFRRFDRRRRVALARRMAAIAQADDELRRHESRFMMRVLDMLDLDKADIATAK